MDEVKEDELFKKLKQVLHNKIPKEDLVENGIYLVDARNFIFALYKDETFYGIRFKFGEEFISPEFYDDGEDRYGTVRPLHLIEVYEWNS